ncbi:MAG: DDE-type integrase/transposase/recombinase [Lachnospiraceae bacterium]|nr:DDE-type integrase/transposase/recombinase [Lachnospiraceae bacterium]
MKRNEIYTHEDQIYRILIVKEDNCLVIDCKNNTMPVWKPVTTFWDASIMTDEELYTLLDFKPVEDDMVSPERKKVMHERYTMIAPVLSFIGDENTRSHVINIIAAENNISKQSIRSFLKKYLVIQNIQVLLPKEREYDTALTKDQKNIRWSLNKYFYTFERNSLKTAYVKMLKEKYCDEAGQLLDTYPSFYQYRYFYRKTRKLENYYISRNGLTNYQRNDRPCVGDNVRVYASAPGLGMVDATVCDIYLVNETGQVVGRPILTACVDAYSGICMGYSLGWEGGVYSIRDMTLNIIEDKEKLCLKHGIHIDEAAWPVNKLPGRIISDQGSEYIGYTFEQIAELGVTLENLPPYRPDLKGPIEKFFDIIQNLYKKNLKGKGVIEPDFQERGAHDYRKDACITMQNFEKIILRCIIYYNTANILEDYPFTEDMLEKNIKPYSNALWDYGCSLSGANLISASKEKLTLCLLPRTLGTYSRNGLSVNKMHYKNDAFKEKYLSGGDAIVAYDPDNSSYVWVIEKGEYIRFDLIESRFKDKSVNDVHDVQELSKRIIREENHNNLQAEVSLATHIQDIVDTTAITIDSGIKGIKDTRRSETVKEHRIHTKEAGLI